jgi:hypothetical protein
MSYDIHLFAPVSGEDPILTAQRDVDESEPSQPLSLDSKSRNARIALRLAELNTAFDIHELASGTEVTWQRDNCAFQLFLADSSGAINMPYWSKNQDQEIFDLIATVLKVVHEETGFLAFDPQSEQLIALDGQSTISTQLFGVGVNVLEKVVPGQPWWKFW